MSEYKYRVCLELFSKHPVRAEEMANMVVGPVLVDRVEMTLVRVQRPIDALCIRQVHKVDHSEDEYARFKMLELGE